MIDTSKLMKYRNIVEIMESNCIKANSGAIEGLKTEDQFICINKDDFKKMQDEMLALFHDHLELEKQNVKLLLLINEIKSESLKGLNFN